eukprot:430492_1
MVTNNKAKTINWLFDYKGCGISYQLLIGNSTAMYHYQNGKQQYKEIIPDRKSISDKWTYNSYGPNETMEMKIDFNSLQLMFFVNSQQVGNSLKIQSNTYYPAIAYVVHNQNFSKYGALKVKL